MDTYNQQQARLGNTSKKSSTHIQYTVCYICYIIFWIFSIIKHSVNHRKIYSSIIKLMTNRVNKDQWTKFKQRFEGILTSINSVNGIISVLFKYVIRKSEPCRTLITCMHFSHARLISVILSLYKLFYYYIFLFPKKGKRGKNIHNTP